MTGMATSMSSKLGRSSSRTASAARPFGALSTLYPSASRNSPKHRRTPGSSSTTRTVPRIGGPPRARRPVCVRTYSKTVLRGKVFLLWLREEYLTPGNRGGLVGVAHRDGAQGRAQSSEVQRRAPRRGRVRHRRGLAGKQIEEVVGERPRPVGG